MLQRKQVFEVLDGLRGLAAFSVVQMHIGDQYGLIYSLNHAYLAVPFFFMLSGIVIAHAYEGGIMLTSRTVAFMRVRIERLYPLLLAALLFDVLIQLTKAMLDPALLALDVLAAVLLLPVQSIPIFPLNPPQWSLAVEIWGNLLHRLALRWLGNGVLAVWIVISFVAMTLLSSRHNSLNVGFSLSTLPAGIAVFVFSYLTGVLIYRLRAQGCLSPVIWPVAVPIVMLSMALAVPQQSDSPLSFARDIVCAAIVFPIVLISAMDIEVSGYMKALCRWLGAMSYPIYITHYPLVALLAQWVRNESASRTMQYASVPVLMLAAIFLAWLCLAADVRIRAKLWSMRNARLNTQPSAMR